MLFERQKLLLALVEALGGCASNTDIQKLMFLWTRKVSEPAFDFVPYRFGAFSFTSYADKRKLVERGFLGDDPNTWALTFAGRDAIAKASSVRERAAVFVAKAPVERGDALVALTYRRYPFFATRSEIAAKLFADDPQSLARIKAAQPLPGTPGIVTLGYEGRSLERYLVLLMESGVTLLCDVRRNPVSRRYGFARSTLSKGCENVGIRYVHMPELGIASSERKGLNSQADFDALFETYERESLPAQSDALVIIAQWVKEGHRVALTCFERLPHQCHRHCVAEALERDFGTEFAPDHL
ncbi:MAG: DUF488 domain-containing protein [Bradymonadaceae bacterium]|nr:DUF488 domain-containing protein [Lujinxingiaceae bacterium]